MATTRDCRYACLVGLLICLLIASHHTLNQLRLQQYTTPNVREPQNCPPITVPRAYVSLWVIPAVQRDFVIWSLSLTQLIAQIGQQASGAPETLRQLYLILRLTLIDSSGVVHPACVDGTREPPDVEHPVLLALLLALCLCACDVHAAACRQVAPYTPGSTCVARAVARAVCACDVHAAACRQVAPCTPGR